MHSISDYPSELTKFFRLLTESKVEAPMKIIIRIDDDVYYHISRSSQINYQLIKKAPILESEIFREKEILPKVISFHPISLELWCGQTMMVRYSYS